MNAKPKSYPDFVNLKYDFQAGLNVALLAIPQGMAYALIAGLPLHYGLIGSGIAALIGGICGQGKFITLGPTNATAVLLFGIFASLGMILEDRSLNLFALSVIPSVLICTSIILVIAGIFKISFLIKFISSTVITGYISAAALLIVANQIPSILGIKPNRDLGTSFVDLFTHVVGNFHNVSVSQLLLGLITTTVFIALQKFSKASPNVAITLIICSILSHTSLLGSGDVVYLKSLNFDQFALTLPNISNSLQIWSTILQASFALSILCLIEGLSIGKSLASRHGSRINENREAISFGIGNLGCALFSGMPASGSLTRSSLNVNSGAKTKFSNVFTGILILLCLFSFGRYSSLIPVCVLATLVVFIGISLIKWSHLKAAIRTSRSDAITFFITFFIGIFFSLQMAIFLGVVTSLILFLKKVAEPEMTEHGYNEFGELAEINTYSNRSDAEVSIVHVEGELFFAAADLFYEQIRRVGERRNIKVLILKLLNARHLDATSVLALKELQDYYNENGCSVLLCEVRKDAIKVLRNSGFLDIINRKNIFPHILSNPTLSTANAVKRAKELIRDEKVNLTIYSDEKKDSR